MARRPPRCTDAPPGPGPRHRPKNPQAPESRAFRGRFAVRRAAWRRCPAQNVQRPLRKRPGPLLAYGKRALFAPLAMPKPRRGPPFSRKVVISRKIENSRQTDGNPDNLLKFLISPAVNSSQVFSLGFVMGGRSFLPVGEIKSSRFLYENSCSRFNIFSYLRYLWHYLNGTTVPTTRPIKYTMPM